MQIHIEYSTQIRAATGKHLDTIELETGMTAVDLLRVLTQASGSQLATWVTPDFQPRPGLLLFINDATPASLSTATLHEGDHVALMTLVSGG